jgi:hypothetical protein
MDNPRFLRGFLKNTQCAAIGFADDSVIAKKMANISLTLYTNGLFASVLVSPTRITRSRISDAWAPLRVSSELLTMTHLIRVTPCATTPGRRAWTLWTLLTWTCPSLPMPTWCRTVRPICRCCPSSVPSRIPPLGSWRPSPWTIP